MRVTSRESRFGFHQCHYINLYTISVTYPAIYNYSKSNNLKSLVCRTANTMAITAAERKNKRREKLKTQELYEQHQTNNAGYTFREREQERLDKIFEVKTSGRHI